MSRMRKIHWLFLMPLLSVAFAGFYSCQVGREKTDGSPKVASQDRSVKVQPDELRKKARLVVYENYLKIREAAEEDPNLSKYLTSELQPIDQLPKIDQKLLTANPTKPSILWNNPSAYFKLVDRFNLELGAEPADVLKGEEIIEHIPENPITGQPLRFLEQEFSPGNIYIKVINNKDEIESFKDIYAIQFSNVDLQDPLNLIVYYFRIYGSKSVIMESFWFEGGQPRPKGRLPIITELDYQLAQYYTEEELSRWIDSLNRNQSLLYGDSAPYVTKDNWRELPIIRFRFKSIDEVPPHLRQLAEENQLLMDLLKTIEKQRKEIAIRQGR